MKASPEASALAVPPPPAMRTSGAPVSSPQKAKPQLEIVARTPAPFEEDDNFPELYSGGVPASALGGWDDDGPLDAPLPVTADDRRGSGARGSSSASS